MYVDKLMETTTIIAQHIEFTRMYQNLGVIPPSWQNVETVFLRACTHWICKRYRSGRMWRISRSLQIPCWNGYFITRSIIPCAMAVRKKTSISLAAQETSEGLIITIEDDGIGIPSQDKEKIFRRGFGKNTGLGLFLAREILSITGIGLRETGEYLQGARFELFIPKGAYRYATPPGHRGISRHES